MLRSWEIRRCISRTEIDGANFNRVMKGGGDDKGIISAQRGRRSQFRESLSDNGDGISFSAFIRYYAFSLRNKTRTFPVIHTPANVGQTRFSRLLV